MQISTPMIGEKGTTPPTCLGGFPFQGYHGFSSLSLCVSLFTSLRMHCIFTPYSLLLHVLDIFLPYLLLMKHSWNMGHLEDYIFLMEHKINWAIK